MTTAAIALVALAAAGPAVAASALSMTPQPIRANALMAQAAMLRGAAVSRGRKLELRAGVALLHEDAEGLNQGEPELRLLLSEAPVEVGLLRGSNPIARLLDLSARGQLSGVLIRLNPADPSQVWVVPLAGVPEAGGASGIGTISLSGTGGQRVGLFERYVFTPARLQATFEHRENPSDLPPQAEPLQSLDFQLDLPVRRDGAITARVTGGPAVRATPQGQLSLAWARLLATLTPAGLADLRAQPSSPFPPLPAEPADQELVPALRTMAAEQLQLLEGANLELIERGDRAVLVIRDPAGGLSSWQDFRFEQGRWIYEP